MDDQRLKHFLCAETWLIKLSEQKLYSSGHNGKRKLFCVVVTNQEGYCEDSS
jgi:hypothetical protein